MNRSIVRLDEATVNYIVGQFLFEHMPEEIINDDKFRMEVTRYKNKDVRVVIKCSSVGTVKAIMATIEAESANH